MIWNNDINAKRNGMYEETIKNLEKSKDILNDRLAKKTISNEEYTKKVKELEAQIQKYKALIGAN
jgi:uncharacterized membrane protein